MSARTAFRRALLTTTRIRPTQTTATFTTPVTPRFAQAARSPATPRYFSNTAKMGKEGVHNLTTKADFDAAVGQSGLMVLDCFATWCGPCKVIAPQVVKMSDIYENARFYKVDVDEVPDVAQELGVRAMPTFYLFKNGEKVGEVVGANPTALETAIKNNVA